MTDTWMDIEQCAGEIAMHPYTVRRWLEKKKLTGYQFGAHGQWRVKRSDWEKFIAESRNIQDEDEK